MRNRELGLSIYAALIIGCIMAFFHACYQSDYLNYSGPVFRPFMQAENHKPAIAKRQIMIQKAFMDNKSRK